MLPVVRCLRFQISPDSHGRVCRYGNDGNFIRFPAGRDLAGAHEFPVCADLSGLYDLPGLYPISHGYAFEGASQHFLVYGFSGVIIIKDDDGFSAVSLEPCPLNLPEDFVPVMVKEQDSDFVEAGKINCSGAVV